MSNKYYLGIDPSLTGTGISLFKNNKLINYKVIKTTKDFTDTERHKIIIEEICEIIDLIIKEKNDINIIIEGLSFMSIGNAKTRLAELYGIIKYILYIKYNITPTIVPPKAWKSYVLKNGKADKLSSLLFAEKQFNIKLQNKIKKIQKENENIADAICIAYYKYLKDRGDNAIS